MKETVSILSQLRVDDIDIESSVRLKMPPKIRKSTPGEFFQVHASKSWTVMGLTNVQGPEIYFVGPQAMEGIKDDLVPIKINACINREGEGFFLLQKLAGKNGKTNSWSESFAYGMEVGKKSWIRMKSGDQAYEVTVAKGALNAPDWTEFEKDMDQHLEDALRPYFIENSDHVVLKKLRGEI